MTPAPQNLPSIENTAYKGTINCESLWRIRVKYLVTVLLFLSSFASSAEDPLPASKGTVSTPLFIHTEIGDLAYETSIVNDAIKAVEKSSFPLSLDDKFTDTPFLYFF